MKTIPSYSTDSNNGASISALLIGFFALMLLPALTSAQVNYAVDADIAYVVDSPNASGDIVIASTYNGYPVQFIQNSAFVNCSGLTSVTIPNSITDIRSEAFYLCTNLASVTFGDSLATIEENAFFGCHSLTSVAIPDSVTSIGSYAFGFCAGLTSVTTGDGLSSIGGAFTGCTGLRNIVIGSSVNFIDGIELQNLPSLTNITVVASNPAYSSVDGVLFNKTQTILIKFPEGRGGVYAIPSGVTEIGYGAFYFCAGLTS